MQWVKTKKRMNEKINFFAESINFRLRKKIILRRWIEETVLKEGKISGNVNFIFCNDTYLLKLNLKYLKHNTLTDVISFSFADREEHVCGDIFLSIDRIKENSRKFKQPFQVELLRVMIHGVLHLIGYNDSTEDEKKQMRRKEDQYLSKILPTFLTAPVKIKNK